MLRPVPPRTSCLLRRQGLQALEISMTSELLPTAQLLSSSPSSSCCCCKTPLDSRRRLAARRISSQGRSRIRLLPCSQAAPAKVHMLVRCKKCEVERTISRTPPESQRACTARMPHVPLLLICPGLTGRGAWIWQQVLRASWRR